MSLSKTIHELLSDASAMLKESDHIQKLWLAVDETSKRNKNGLLTYDEILALLSGKLIVFSEAGPVDCMVAMPS